MWFQASSRIICPYPTAFANGRYNLSFECRNFTDEQLYDNFSLQKAGRHFMERYAYTSAIETMNKPVTISVI